MKLLFLGLLSFLTSSWITNASKCPVKQKPPSECMDIDDIKEYGETSLEIESIYNRYVNALTDADFIIDGDEAGVNLFFGGELSDKVKKLKYYGNSIVTFLSTALHHGCRTSDVTGQDFLYCLKQQNLTADDFGICVPYDKINCSTKMTNFQPVNGICVNPENPYLGAINTPFRRLLDNTYDDGIHEVRSSVHNNDLPSTRLLTVGLRKLFIPHNDYEGAPTENIHNDFLLIYMFLVISDLSKTLKAQTWAGNYGFECCDCDGKRPVSQRFNNRHCMPIEIPATDPIFKGRRCMNYIRAMLTHDNCQFNEAKILNSVTHYLDMDFLYVSATVKDALKNGGKFKEDEKSIHQTIVLGDERNTWYPEFYATTIVWIKFHNCVFDELTRLYPKLDSKWRFYETRRYVIAVYQNILITEVLPLYLSETAITRYELDITEPCYSPDADPSVTDEFTSSAARIMHNFIPNTYKVNFKNGTTADIQLRHLNNDVDLGFNEYLGLITGTLDVPWNTKDISIEMSNFFMTSGGPGLDLRAIDLQTERDHGLATYCDVLYYFNMTNGECIKKFDDFQNFTSEENIEFLNYAYEHPCDVDFGVGASLHNNGDGGIVSDVVERIFGSQFKKSKCGDPYFYTNSLSEDQIRVVERISYKDILCITIPDLPPVQPYVFITPGPNNTAEACSTEFYLDDWKLLIDPEKPPVEPTTPAPATTAFTVPHDFYDDSTDGTTVPVPY